ncbi:MAG: Phosphoribosylformylglycinamidine synthase subunit PurQ [Planctomycetes bacterium]|nr:Phosphoribosylformylglycinamidine synthase subunit PurQ [Planctomycetota bacterium]
MSAVRAVVLRTAGTNCDAEAMHALRRAGAQPELVHLRRLVEKPEEARGYRIFCFPGGFSYGDDIASGVVFAVEMRARLLPAIRASVADGALAIGICNGFQVLARAGLLPDTRGDGGPEATLLHNDSGRFECRWVRLEAVTDRCAWLSRGQVIECPVAHGEGRFIVKDERVRERMQAAGQFALRYTAPGGGKPAYPANPNGSPDDIAGVCDPTGRILGLMPHPERNVEAWHHPHWTRRSQSNAALLETPGDGLAVFENGVRAARAT